MRFINVLLVVQALALLSSISCGGGGGSSSTSIPTPTAPSISAFVASPTSITSGQSATLTWSVSGATSLNVAPGIGNVNGSNVNVSPTSTTTYTLTATNSAGSSTSTLTVTVTSAGPIISSFSASPSSITAGQNSPLSWSVSGATSLSISPGVGTVAGSNVNVSPANTTTYTLQALNSAGSSTSTTTVTVTSTAPTVSEGISYSKAMVQDLVNTQTTVGTNFWDPQGVNVTNSLQGASLDSARYGNDLDWLKNAIQKLDGGGGTISTGYFTTGHWEYVSTYSPTYTYTWSEKKWPYSLTKSGTSYNYSIAVGTINFTGLASNISRRSDGSILGFTLTNARFPGELVGTYQSSSNQSSYTWVMKGSDILNITMTNQGGSTQAANGTIEGYNLVSSLPTIQTTLNSATWDEVATGGTELNSHAWLPKTLAVKITTGSYRFDGTIDCTAYQSNSTAAQAISDGPSWGWHSLNTSGMTFTNAHFVGTALNGQGAEVDIDFSVSLQNYPSLRLDLPRSNSNAPLLQSSATAKLQMPAQPLLTLTVGAVTSGLYSISSTLDYVFGTAHITGTGVYYPPITGQASSWLLTAILKNERGVQVTVYESLAGKFSGSVSYYGLTIGTIEDVGFGPRVRYTDGTFQTLW